MPTPGAYSEGKAGRYSRSPTGEETAALVTGRSTGDGCGSRVDERDRVAGLGVHPADAPLLEPQPDRAVRFREEMRRRRNLEQVVPRLHGQQVVRAERLDDDHGGFDQALARLRLDNDRLGSDAKDEPATGGRPRGRIGELERAPAQVHERDGAVPGDL